MTYAWYPGCSLRGTGRAYEESLLAVFKALGVEVAELKDWNCCGSTTYLSVDELTSYALVARNLALAGREHRDIVAPCAACYMVLNKTQHYVDDYPDVRLAVNRAMEAIGLVYDDRVKVRHPLDVLLNDVGVKAIKEKVTKPLKGLKVAPYYGCQIVRPYATFDDQANPVAMDRLLEACGAKVVHYPLKTTCCGGSQKGALPEVGLDLIHYLITEAKRQGADVMATVCPLCQFNVEAFQQDAASSRPTVSMPVLYFSQLMGLALGCSAGDIGLRRCLVSVEPLLAEKEIAYA
ncbi:MAG: CoB--CoM heterodisulfide reductase iron-sulfur subunit B family protein [Bryobacteraceae bacterium]|jgi:heterodisulfide reductase subunit B